MQIAVIHHDLFISHIFTSAHWKILEFSTRVGTTYQNYSSYILSNHSHSTDGLFFSQNIKFYP